MLANYRRLFAVPHVLSLLTWSLAARFYTPGLMIAVTFLVQGWTGSYTLAGLVAGAFTLGMALVGPLRGRMADRGNSDRLVLVCGVVFTVGLTALALLPASLWWVSIPLALGTGLFGTPANQIVRALWPRLTTGSERQAIYAAEATTQELLFVFSPILTAGVVALAGPRWALLLLGALGLMGAVGFALSLRRAGVTGPAAPDPGAAPSRGATTSGEGDEGDEGSGHSGRPRRSLLFHPALCLVFAMCMMIVSGVVGMDLVIVAWANELNAPHYVMVLASVWALGSLVGGAVAGSLKGTPRVALRAFGAALGIAVLVPFLPPVSHLPTPLLITPLLFVSGLALAPTLAAVMGRLGDTAPAHRRAEAFGWMATAMSTGAAVAGPLTGALVDTNGIAGGALGAAGLVLMAAVLSLFLPRTNEPAGAGSGTGPSAAAADTVPAVENTALRTAGAALEATPTGPAPVSPPNRPEPGAPTAGHAPAGPTTTAESPHRPSDR
ncbi:MFS transporter [Nocardiopsis metallicus]|uniref:MFS family permease n=1 Tax=Nocardiopsis metallicus TaxID=179819 RepID=A0A840W822_9ACTN|nr:MFS transporter [Nocardiopsis metallicus]MBB5492182.1 MFS family permease [Nocardiopsis metallicus]